MSSYHHLYVQLQHSVLHANGICYFLPLFGFGVNRTRQQNVCETFVISSAVQLLLKEPHLLKDAMTNLNQRLLPCLPRYGFLLMGRDTTLCRHVVPCPQQSRSRRVSACTVTTVTVQLPTPERKIPRERRRLFVFTIASIFKTSKIRRNRGTWLVAIASVCCQTR